MRLQKEWGRQHGKKKGEGKSLGQPGSNAFEKLMSNCPFGPLSNEVAIAKGASSFGQWEGNGGEGEEQFGSKKGGGTLGT